MSILRDLILNADDLPFEDIEIPEWGATVRVRAMDAESRARFAMSGTKADGERDEEAYINSSARVAVMVCEDPATNQRIFTETDIGALMKKNAKALDKITKKAFELSGFNDDEKAVVEDQFRQ